MYIPNKFEVTENENILCFIKENGFGQITSQQNGRLCSSHLPFLMSDDGSKLICHLARKNPQWMDIENQEVLITFSGPHGYISPSWYQTPGVPTWNYQAVHVYGKATLITDNQRLMAIVTGLTKVYEDSFQQPWVPDYPESMLKAIVGIEIEISEFQAKFKLSQNRSENDQQQVSDELAKNGSVALSEAMKQTFK